jgi:UPF0271 protein
VLAFGQRSHGRRRVLLDVPISVEAVLDLVAYDAIMLTIDLNADVGEGFDADVDLMTVVSSANVACGFHAGDAESMRTTCALAVAHDVAIGAQVSYRDREGFGRRRVDLARAVLSADVAEQIRDLRRAAGYVGGIVSYVKPHGALYNRIVDDEDQAAGVVEVCVDEDLPVLGLPGSQFLALAAERGLVTRREFFADRAYDQRGRLVPRSDPGAVIEDADAVARRVAILLDRGRVSSIEGTLVDVEADSICVHGDTPGAARLASRVRDAVLAAGWEVAHP